MTLVVAVYVAGAIIAFVISARVNEPECEIDVLAPGVIALLWPFMLALFALMLVYAGLYHLARIGRRP